MWETYKSGRGDRWDVWNLILSPSELTANVRDVSFCSSYAGQFTLPTQLTDPLFGKLFRFWNIHVNYKVYIVCLTM